MGKRKMRSVLAIIMVATFSVIASPAAAHDTGLDSRFGDDSDPVHSCHHLRISYWEEMIDAIRDRIERLRYRHAGVPITDPDYWEVVEKLREAQEKSLAILDDKAKALGCHPWPGSG